MQKKRKEGKEFSSVEKDEQSYSRMLFGIGPKSKPHDIMVMIPSFQNTSWSFAFEWENQNWFGFRFKNTDCEHWQNQFNSISASAYF